jgi:hypothetical protein
VTTFIFSQLYKKPFSLFFRQNQPFHFLNFSTSRFLIFHTTFFFNKILRIVKSLENHYGLFLTPFPCQILVHYYDQNIMINFSNGGFNLSNNVMIWEEWNFWILKINVMDHPFNGLVGHVKCTNLYINACINKFTTLKELEEWFTFCICFSK